MTTWSQWITHWRCVSCESSGINRPPESQRRVEQRNEQTTGFHIKKKKIYCQKHSILSGFVYKSINKIMKMLLKLFTSYNIMLKLMDVFYYVSLKVKWHLHSSSTKVLSSVVKFLALSSSCSSLFVFNIFFGWSDIVRSNPWWFSNFYIGD